MDVLGSAAAVIQLAGAVATSLQGIYKVISAIRQAAAQIKEYEGRICYLIKVLEEIDQVCIQRQLSSQQDVEKRHRKQISVIVRDCQKLLEELQERLDRIQQVPVKGHVKGLRRRLWGSTLIQDSQQGIKLLLNQDVERIFKHLGHYTKLLHLSIETMSLFKLYQIHDSQSRIEEQFRKLTPGLRELNRRIRRAVESSEEEYPHVLQCQEIEIGEDGVVLRNILEWKRSADTVVEATLSQHSLYAPILPPLGRGEEEMDRRPWEEPRHRPSDTSGARLLLYEYRACRRLVERLRAVESFEQASNNQKKAMQLREKLSDDVLATDLEDPSQLKEELADILTDCETSASLDEAITCLQGLLDELQRQAPEDLTLSSRISHKLGKALLSSDPVRAGDFLQRAFTDRFSIRPRVEEDLTETAECLLDACLLSQNRTRYDAVLNMMRAEVNQQFGPKQSQFREALTWCQNNNYSISETDQHPGFDVLGGDGSAPIHGAARDVKQGIIVMGQMLDNMADENIELRDTCGNTPLLAAVTMSNEQVVELLLQRGASPTARDDEGLTIIHKCQTTRMITLLLQPAARRPSGATVRSHASSTEGSIGSDGPSPGIDVDATDMFGRTALYHACEKGLLDLVGCLLRCGADPGIVGPGNQSALVAAIVTPGLKASTRVNIVRVLLSRKADPYTKDSNGINAFNAHAGLAGSEIKRVLKEHALLQRRPTGSQQSLPSIQWSLPAREKDLSPTRVPVAEHVEVSRTSQPSSPRTAP